MDTLIKILEEYLGDNNAPDDLVIEIGDTITRKHLDQLGFETNEGRLVVSKEEAGDLLEMLSLPKEKDYANHWKWEKGGPIIPGARS